jgi:hypothetical protein
MLPVYGQYVSFQLDYHFGFQNKPFYHTVRRYASDGNTQIYIL